MRSNIRNGKISRPLIIILVVFVLLVAGSFLGWKIFAGGETGLQPPQMVRVKKETFVHEILERGSVESAVNVDVTCGVESNAGVTILTIVPEGTEVKKGDLLIEFDASTFLETVNKQQIAALNSQAKVAQSEADLETAKLELEEYIEGKYVESLKTIESKILQAEETLRTSEDTLKFSSNLLARGYTTESQVEADEFLFKQAKTTLSIAELEHENLEKYTKKKMVNQLQAKIDAAIAKLETDKKSRDLDRERLKHLEFQLEKCKVYAPQDGQVVYAPPRWGDETEIIREGKKVYERQQIIKLPDPTKMQVKGLVNEANIRLVKVGDPATIELEAFPNQVLLGSVKIVNDYPEPTGWNATSMSREYQTTVTILEPPHGIKPGLTAKVKIVVDVIRDALTLPSQAVFEHGGKMYCVVYDQGNWDKKEIETGATNEKQVVIRSGLAEGDSVVLNAWQNREKLKLPKIEKDEHSGPLSDESGEVKQRPGGEQGGERKEGKSGQQKNKDDSKEKSAEKTEKPAEQAGKTVEQTEKLDAPKEESAVSQEKPVEPKENSPHDSAAEKKAETPISQEKTTT